jgi:alpha-glucosidase
MRLETLATLLSVCSLAACGTTPKEEDPDWWKHATFYQIYPRSFQDSTNDGIGDLQGIIDKIDLFPDAGVDAVWLSPIFDSPQVDQGYDISNYTDIDSDYGTIEDLQKLVEEANARGVKVVLDFVPNHTSDKHQWFIDSVNGVEEYRDYYIWANAKTGDDGERLPPNNWISMFKNSAWTWNEERQQYYLHQFASAQPDLNYRNPKVVEAMKDVLRFWLDRGIDGFRIDAVPYLFEDPDLQDEPLSNSTGYNSTDYEYLDHIYTKDLYDTFDMIYQWRQLVDDYTKENGGSTRVLMTEAYTDADKIMLYYGTADGSRLGAHFTFNFNLITDININSTAEDIASSINKWLDGIPEIYTSNWVLGNHDNHRVATRLGPGNIDGLNMVKALLPGVAVTYNGEEIGQEDGEVSYEEGQDPSARDPAIFDQVSRDFERTPYQWDESVNAGFNTGAKPWLPVSEKYLETNLQDEKESNGSSHYKVYQALAKIRSDPILVSGDVEVKAVDEYTLLVKRSNEEASLVVVFNVGDAEVTVDVSADVAEDNSVQIASVDSSREAGSVVDPASLKLDAHEALVIAS